MVKSTVTLAVVDGRTITQTATLHGGKAGVVKIRAIKGGQFILANDRTGHAPENITIKRVGKNLHLSLEGDDLDHPSAVIEDFYGSEAQLLGVGEDGAYHEYVAAGLPGDHEAAALVDGTSAKAVLDTQSAIDLGGIAGSSALNLSRVGLLGLAAVGLGVGISSAVSGSSDSTGMARVDSSATGGAADALTRLMPAIDSITDNEGDEAKSVVFGGTTSDVTPVIGGTSQPGDLIVVFLDGKRIGTTVVGDDGRWTFEPTIALAEGEHKFVVVAIDGAGTASEQSNTVSVIVDTTAPSKPTIDHITDNAGDTLVPIASGGTTSDATPVLDGKGEPGATIEVIVDGEPVGTTVVNEDGTWTFEPETPLADGEHQIEVVAQDDAGNRSEPSDPVVVVVDTTAPSKPTIDHITDNAGDTLVPIASGGTTSDATPVLDGKGEPGATIEVIVDGEPVGTTVVNEDGTWTFEPETPLADGEHQIEVVAQDDAGNRSEPSEPVVVVVDTTAPSKPTIDHITDNAGDTLVPIASGGTTSDATPVLDGKGEPGATIEVIVDGEPVGTTVVNEDGTWTFEP
ncbi:Ig-like domain-containing protein, partial [Burkholderia sp. MSMB1078WGS]|uniref:Ig-like domain-containing protein n=1 Tax=Burkholderia sp. MSMB1078WGS TaxID=1637900 RepID=UPI00211D6435